MQRLTNAFYIQSPRLETSFPILLPEALTRVDSDIPLGTNSELTITVLERTTALFRFSVLHSGAVRIQLRR